MLKREKMTSSTITSTAMNSSTGGRNADRTVDALAACGHQVVKVVELVWKAMKQKVIRMGDWLQTALVKKGDDYIVVFQSRCKLRYTCQR